jgi:hypothetical protein
VDRRFTVRGLFRAIRRPRRRFSRAVRAGYFALARVTGPKTATVATRHGTFSVSTSDRVIGRALFLRGHYQYRLLQRTCSLLQRFDLLTPRR